jgi:hypothetical protein
VLERLAATFEAVIDRSVVVVTYDIDKGQLSPSTGYVEGEITFNDGSRLVFFEFLRRTYFSTS